MSYKKCNIDIIDKQIVKAYFFSKINIYNIFNTLYSFIL